MAEEKTEEKKKKDRRNQKATDQTNQIVRYFRQTRAELRKVTWPTPEEARRLTGIVLAVTIVMALFLGLMDWSFSQMVTLMVDLIVGG